jgi:hypothetical protein
MLAEAVPNDHRTIETATRRDDSPLPQGMSSGCPRPPHPPDRLAASLSLGRFGPRSSRHRRRRRGVGGQGHQAHLAQSRDSPDRIDRPAAQCVSAQANVHGRTVMCGYNFLGVDRQSCVVRLRAGNEIALVSQGYAAKSPKTRAGRQRRLTPASRVGYRVGLVPLTSHFATASTHHRRDEQSTADGNLTGFLLPAVLHTGRRITAV